MDETWKNLAGGVVAALAAMVAMAWGELHWLVKLLIVMALADMLLGLLLATVERRLSVDVMFRGVAKKVVTFVLVGIALFVDQQTGRALPLTEAAAAFFVAREGLSVFRNAELLGVPVPAVLKDRFSSLAPSEPTLPPKVA